MCKPEGVCAELVVCTTGGGNINRTVGRQIRCSDGFPEAAETSPGMTPPMDGHAQLFDWGSQHLGMKTGSILSSSLPPSLRTLGMPSNLSLSDQGSRLGTHSLGDAGDPLLVRSRGCPVRAEKSQPTGSTYTCEELGGWSISSKGPESSLRASEAVKQRYRKSGCQESRQLLCHAVQSRLRWTAAQHT